MTWNDLSNSKLTHILVRVLP